MIISTFQELYGDRLIINLVAGTFDDEEILFTGNNGKKTNCEEKIKRIIVSRVDSVVAKARGIPLREYIEQGILEIAKKRRWKWYLKRKQK